MAEPPPLQTPLEPFYVYLKGLTDEYERVAREKANLRDLLYDAANLVSEKESIVDVEALRCAEKAAGVSTVCFDGEVRCTPPVKVQDAAPANSEALLQKKDGNSAQKAVAVIWEKAPEPVAAVPASREEAPAPMVKLMSQDSMDLQAFPVTSMSSRKLRIVDKAERIKNYDKDDLAYEVEVLLYGVEGLRGFDSWTAFLGRGASDPYCVCEVRGKSKAKFQTHYIQDDNNPQWNVKAVISDFHHSDSFEFTVYDKEVLNDEAIGRASLSFSDFRDSGFDFQSHLLLEEVRNDGGEQSERSMEAWLKVDVKVTESFSKDSAVYKEPEPAKFTVERRGGGRNSVALILEKQEQEEEEAALAKAPPEPWIVRLKNFFRSELFEVILASILVCNVLLMCTEIEYLGWQSGYVLGYRRFDLPASHKMPHGAEVFLVFNYVFSAIFAIDVVVRLAVFRLAFFKDDLLNWVDFGVVTASWVTVVVVDTSSGSESQILLLRWLRFGKLLRAVKLIRLSRNVDSLFLLFSCLTSSGNILFWTTVLLVLFQCIAGLVISNMVQPYIEDESQDIDGRLAVFRYYGTFANTFVTMWEILFANWAPSCRVLTDYVNEAYAVFFLIYRCLIGFALLNVVNAVFVQSTLKVAQQDEQVAMAQKRKAQDAVNRKLRLMFGALDTSGDGSINWEEFSELVVSPKIQFWLSQLDIESSDLVSLFHLLDDGDGEISLQEFLEGTARIRGSARSADVARLLAYCKNLQHSLEDIKDMLPAPKPRMTRRMKAF